MAANVYKIQLSNGNGLCKIIRFNGLGYELTIHPTIHGEPLLTSQAFYYLKNLESVANLRINLGTKVLRPDQIDYLIDNYLFEYSTIDLDSRLTTKVVDFAYWKDDVYSLYHRYDQMNTEALIVDHLNDPSVLDIKPLDSEDDNPLYDWCIPKNYTDEIVQNYVDKMHSLREKKILLFMAPNEHRDGYMGKKRILKCDYGLMDIHQADQLDSIRINPEDKQIKLSSSYGSEYDVILPIVDVECDKLYNPLLLSYYFSGLNDKNPLNSYVGYYNVLEYYFEEAPVILNITATYEKKQLESVIRILTTHSDIYSFINKQPSSFQSEVCNDISTSSPVDILALDITGSDHIISLTRWLYDLRCAVVHSKKTRRGQSTAIFEPYSEESMNIKIASPLIRWLSILCIKKDHDLGNGRTSL